MIAANSGIRNELLTTRNVTRGRRIHSSMKTPGLNQRANAGRRAEAAQPWILAATILASSMAFIDSTVVNVAIPALQAGFQADIIDVQWVVEAYALFLSALILVGGVLGDRYGRRRVFVVGTQDRAACKPFRSHGETHTFMQPQISLGRPGNSACLRKSE